MSRFLSSLILMTASMTGAALLADEPAATQATGVKERALSAKEFVDLFPVDGPPKGWIVTQWNDVSQPAEESTHWLVREGVLYGSNPRGTWLMSEKQYGDFELQFEFKLGPRGNSGVALRAPLKGDPAFDGMELQMADVRYNPDALESELTGGIYRAIAPSKQVYRPTKWNRYAIRLVGNHLHVALNGTVVHDTDLDIHDEPVKRHDGSDAPAINKRPRRGHLGFQELSRGDSQVQIRKARIRTFNDSQQQR